MAAVAGEETRGFRAIRSEEARKHHEITGKDASGYLTAAGIKISRVSDTLALRMGRLTCMRILVYCKRFDRDYHK